MRLARGALRAYPTTFFFRPFSSLFNASGTVKDQEGFFFPFFLSPLNT